jgi:hypothetical protein
MIGECIQSPRPAAWGGILWGLFAAGFAVAAAATRTIHLAIFAILPFLAGVVLLVARRPRFVAYLTDEGIELEPGRTLVYYDDIDEVAVKEGQVRETGDTQYALQVFHRNGFFTIPATVNVPSQALHEFLKSQLPRASQQPPIHPELCAYLTRQEDLFGQEKVMVYWSRKSLTRPDLTVGKRLSLALALAGVCWMVIAPCHASVRGWFAAGVVALIFGSFLYLLFWLAERRGHTRIATLRDASLIIGPAGIALIQGKLRGELVWDELRDVKLKQRGHLAGVILTVEGASIRIEDIYHRPLREIHRRIVDYWK